MKTHSNILAMKNSRGACWGIVHGVAKSQTRLNDFHFHIVYTNKHYWRRNGNRLQYSRLGNAMDRGTWRAESMGFQKSRT
ncbi:hypothetical protein, partial [Pseudomonas aeruginosa]|uniref:hypothetical protein n=1 Tax=Pseudomonas aeruginosa TaxID=287 RepID=UPI003CED8480